MEITFLITIVSLIIAVYNDYKVRKVKNIIPLMMIVIGIIIHVQQKEINLWYSFFISILFFIFLFFLPRFFKIKEFMGAGDIKLYMGISFLRGYEFSLYTFLYSIIIGSVILLFLNRKRMKGIILNIRLFFFTKGKWKIEETEEKTNMFTIYIFIGCLIEYFFHSNWLSLIIL